MNNLNTIEELPEIVKSKNPIKPSTLSKSRSLLDTSLYYNQLINIEKPNESSYMLTKKHISEKKNFRFNEENNLNNMKDDLKFITNSFIKRELLSIIESPKKKQFNQGEGKISMTSSLYSAKTNNESNKRTSKSTFDKSLTSQFNKQQLHSQKKSSCIIPLVDKRFKFLQRKSNQSNSQLLPNDSEEFTLNLKNQGSINNSKTSNSNRVGAFNLIKSISTSDIKTIPLTISKQESSIKEKVEDIALKIAEKKLKNEKNIENLKAKMATKREYKEIVGIKRKIRSKIYRLLSSNTIFVCDDLLHNIV